MAIFSRRVLQRLIDENHTFLSEGQTKRHVRQLNLMSEELTLAYEWEIVLLNAFSKVGRVSYERSFGGKRYADIYFEGREKPHCNFVADITTVSDKGLDEKNPVQALSIELFKRVRSNNLNPNCYSIDVDCHKESFYRGGPPVRLKIPGRARFPQVIFGTRFESFIQDILERPQLSRRYEVKTADVDVAISYNPNQRFASGHYPSYTVMYSDLVPSFR